MKIFNLNEKQIIKQEKISTIINKDINFFILCHAKEIPSIKNIFNLDESTVIECTNLDESIKYDSFDGYDFVSIVHMQKLNNRIILNEINIYLFDNGIILVMPDKTDDSLDYLENEFIKNIIKINDEQRHLNKELYIIFNILLMESSNLLEKVEDGTEILQEKIMMNVEKVNFADINYYRQMSYTIRKLMRALSYIGSQLLINQNKFIDKNYIRYFHNIDIRLKKQYDLSANLYELSNQLLISYDSRMSTKTMDAVNKLTIITIFFGPLTVITGIYGMNFVNMPEIKWELGYPIALAIMGLVTGIIYLILKRKKWL